MHAMCDCDVAAWWTLEWDEARAVSGRCKRQAAQHQYRCSESTSEIRASKLKNASSQRPKLETSQAPCGSSCLWRNFVVDAGWSELRQVVCIKPERLRLRSATVYSPLPTLWSPKDVTVTSTRPCPSPYQGFWLRVSGILEQNAQAGVRVEGFDEGSGGENDSNTTGKISDSDITDIPTLIVISTTTTAKIIVIVIIIARSGAALCATYSEY
eukprot:586300-Rhodomonas_salina.1